MRPTLRTPVSLGAWLAFGVATGSFLFEFVARILPSPATSDIAAWLCLRSARTGTLSSLFFWVYAPMQIGVGVLLDRHGARRLMRPAIAACVAGAWVFQPLLGALIDAADGAFGTAMVTIPASGLLAALLTLTIHEYRHPGHVD